MTSELPTPRRLITSLINSLTNPPSATTQPQTTNSSCSNSQSNLLKSLPASYHALLTTLHVLFPPPTFLQALDLLDRGLVTRVILQSQTPQHHEATLEGTVQPPQENLNLLEVGCDKAAPENARNGVYQVRSSQASKGRFRDVTASSAMVYTVRLDAWNCSCAAFAFAAFPGNGIGATLWSMDRQEDEDAAGDEMEGEEKAWEFGGLSSDGIDGGNVPVCKHLLACLLGERWEGVLGGYIKEREVGREEMAGIGGEG